MGVDKRRQRLAEFHAAYSTKGYAPAKTTLEIINKQSVDR